MRVLLSAYSARAGHGTEPGIGWGWGRHLAEAGHHVTLLTHERHAPANDTWLAQRQLDNLHIEYVASPTLSRALHGRLLSERSARLLAYLAWQRVALRRAQVLHAVSGFDVVHHVTYSSMIAGSPMWRLGAPFVFGPVGSGHLVPAAARPLFATGWPREQLRSGIVTATGWHLNPLARAAVRHAAVVLATNDATAQLARRLGARRVELMCDTGIDPPLAGRPRRPPQRGPRRVLWVGRLEPLKGLRLAVEAVAQAARHTDLEIHIVGHGSQAAELARWTEELGLAERSNHHGYLAWSEVQELYAASDVLLFTSVRETFGSQLVEAAASALPIVAVDLHGVASILPDHAALKVPFIDVHTTATALSDALTRVLTNNATYATLSAGAVSFAQSQTWPERVHRIERLYAESMSGLAV